MKVSVIVPVYNRLEHFRALFLCLLRQKKQPDELIITDDGSSQKVLDFIGDLIPKAQFKVKHIYQEDKGFRKTRALNNAVRNSTGDLLIFCDQDLIFGEEYIETIANNIKNNIFLMGRAHHTTEDEKNIILSDIENINSYNEIIKKLPAKYIETIDKMLKEKHEYIDIYEVGIEDEILENSGFIERVEEDSNIIPNYFEPFIQKNIEIYYMSNCNSKFRMFKGDGDQDRPSIVKEKKDEE